MNIFGKDRACDACHRVRPIESLEIIWQHGYKRWVCAGGCDPMPETMPPARPVVPVGCEAEVVT